MRVVGKKVDWDNIPVQIARFANQAQTPISSGREYTVLTVSVFEDVMFFLVVDDQGEPRLVPSWLFDIVSPRIPRQWICNFDLGQGVSLVLGPPFIARDLDAYSRVVDRDPDTMYQVFRRSVPESR
jgi:hypothetical protein